MKQLMVETPQFEYPILIGYHILDRLKSYVESATKIIVITDQNVESLHLKTLLTTLNKPTELLSIIPGETSKSLQKYVEIQSFLIEKNIDRYSLILAFGGGVVGDLAGFVAATYMRGISYLQIPTTLLAHDSAVGGKVAVNHELGKNLIGAFYPPTAVIYELTFLSTLNDKEWRSGLAEMVKHGYISDPQLLQTLLSIGDLETFKLLSLEDVLMESIKVKNQIVERDPFEKSVRAYLNFGHTLAHGIELVHPSLSHGEAVAIGIGFALYLSECINEEKDLFNEYLKFLNQLHYPVPISKTHMEQYLSYMTRDKKNKGDEIRFILLNSVSKPEFKSLKVQEVEIYLNSYIEQLMGVSEDVVKRNIGSGE